MHSKETLIPPNLIDASKVVFDIVYSPGGTPLIRDAKEAGATVIDGVNMLVHQGAASFRIWFAREPPISLMEKVVRSTLSDEGMLSAP